jgi:hypothetical protein
MRVVGGLSNRLYGNLTRRRGGAEGEQHLWWRCGISSLKIYEQESTPITRTEPQHLLSGYTVLDFTQVLAGPTVTRLMAENEGVLKQDLAK